MTAAVHNGGDLLNAVVGATPVGYAEDCWQAVQEIADYAIGSFGSQAAELAQAEEIEAAYRAEHGDPAVVPDDRLIREAMEVRGVLGFVGGFLTTWADETLPPSEPAGTPIGAVLEEFRRYREILGVSGAYWRHEARASPSASPLQQDGDAGAATAPELGDPEPSNGHQRERQPLMGKATIEVTWDDDDTTPPALGGAGGEALAAQPRCHHHGDGRAHESPRR